MGSASSAETNGSWRTSSWFFLDGLEISQMVEQLFGLGVVRRQLQCFLSFRSREIGLLLLKVDFRQHRSNYSGIPRLQRCLQFLHGIIHFALAVVNFSQPAVCGRTRGISGKHGAKFLLRGVGISGGELLSAASQVRD